jgi:hypothetical protein
MRKLKVGLVFATFLLFKATIGLASDKAEPTKDECGHVFGIVVGKDQIKVLIHPDGVSAPSAGGYNSGFNFIKADTDLEIVASTALKALDSKTLKFCLDHSDAHARFGKNPFYIVDSQ